MTKIKNNIKPLREKIGLSQRALAKAAGTNQSQLQRIEAGVQEVRLDIAVRICKALGVVMDEVFPKTKKILAKANKTHESHEDFVKKVTTQPEYVKGLGAAGIDVTGNDWYMDCRFAGGLSKAWPISENTKKALSPHLFSKVQDNDPDGFVFFDSEAVRVGLNPRFLLAWEFDYRGGIGTEERTPLRIFFADGGKPLERNVYPDEADMNDLDEEEGDDLGELAPIQNMLNQLAMGGASSSILAVTEFRDDEDAEVHFRPPLVSCIEVPLWVVVPGLDMAPDDEDDDTGEEDEPAAADEAIPAIDAPSTESVQ